MKRSVVNSIAIIAILCFIACGQTFFLLAQEGAEAAIVPLTVIVALLTLDFYTVTVLNIRLLIPRLLLHNRFIAYAFSILAFTAIAIGIDFFSEYLLVSQYQIQPGEGWYLFKDDKKFLVLFSAFTSYFISFAGTGIIFFLHLWNQSGKRLDDLEKQNARNELDKVRTQIDSGSLFDTLDKSADRVIQSPAEVTALLMDLSKQLRTQLYESRQKQQIASKEFSSETFDLASPVLNFLTEKRYHLWRHLLLIIWFALIVSPNFDGSFFSILSAVIPLMIYLVMVYFNVYVLIPKLMMQGKKTAYFVVTSMLFLVCIRALVSLRVMDIGVMENISPWFPAFYIVSNSIKLCFPIYGVIVFRLFQYWVRNQRRIAELETATMLSELEQLQNQVNPHFLFNMLNNSMVLTKTNPKEAAVVLRKLSAMLKYQFHGFTTQSIHLVDDIHFLTDYLNLEKLRRDNFEFSITANEDIGEISLPPLLFIPFVENAVKHNNDNRNLSFVQLHFSLENDTFCFRCVNSKPVRRMREEEVGGLGLPNVRRRLDLLYDNRYRLEINENETTYSIQLIIELKNKKYKI